MLPFVTRNDGMSCQQFTVSYVEVSKGRLTLDTGIRCRHRNAAVLYSAEQSSRELPKKAPGASPKRQVGSNALSDAARLVSRLKSSAREDGYRIAVSWAIPF